VDPLPDDIGICPSVEMRIRGGTISSQALNVAPSRYSRKPAWLRSWLPIDTPPREILKMLSANSPTNQSARRTRWAERWALVQPEQFSVVGQGR